MNGSGNAATVYLGLGSNLGVRLAALRLAVDALAQTPGVVVDRISGVASLYETAPVGGPPAQNAYLNSVLRITTSLTPAELLRTTLALEASLGRVHTERWEPRTIDVDLLLFDDLVLEDAELTLPHPRLHERRFVLEPLSELAAQVIHPVLGVSIRSLLDRSGTRLLDQHVERIAGPQWLTADVALESVPRPRGCPHRQASRGL